MESAETVNDSQVSESTNSEVSEGGGEEQSLHSQLEQELTKGLQRHLGEAEEAEGEEPEVETAPEAVEEEQDLSAEEIAKQAQPSKKSANDRVRDAVNERNEAKAALAEQAQYFQQQMAQIEQARQRDQAQLAGALRQLAQLESGRLQAERMKAQKEYMERMQQDDPRGYFEQQMLEKAKQQLMPEVQQIRQQLQQQEQQRQKALQQAQFQLEVRKFKQEAERAVEKSFFGELPHVKRNQYAPMVEPLSDMALSYASAYGIPPAEAAAKVLEFVKGYQKLATPPMQQRTEQAKKLAQVAGAAPAKADVKSANVKKPMPDLATLRKAGFDNHLRWIDAGRPPV